MRLLYPENALEVLLRQCYLKPRCQVILPLRYYSTAPRPEKRNNEAKDIAVLGGGITGLASAFYLTKELPDAKITLYEGSSRLGGWLHSKRIDVGNGSVVFEQGPRTLRPNMPNGFVTLDLIRQLEFEDEVLMTSKDSVAARNRFIYYPDHLVRMPGPASSFFENVSTILGEPVFKGFLSAVFYEWGIPARSEHLDDESVGSFIARRLDRKLADNIVSAILHGVYAGDVWQLSMKSIQPLAWYNERRHGSMVDAAFKAFSDGMDSGKTMTLKDAKLMENITKTPVITDKLKGMSGASVYTFKKGIGELADRLEQYLRAKENVTIHTDHPVHLIWPLTPDDAQADAGVAIYSRKTSSTAHNHTHAISTLSSKHLYNAAKAHNLSPLNEIHSVTVMVVNLYFANPTLLSVHGFGYLIPRSIPFHQNPERALGVVFDSDATIGQDSVPGTKLTVMLGGHWWDGWSSYPDEEQGASMAKSVLQRHLGITDEPERVHVGLQKECIPQYTVGHSKRMKDVHYKLRSKWNGRLRVAGNSYTGVGLNDCVRAAKDVVSGLSADEEIRTGLEGFVEEEVWVKARVRTRS